MNKPKTLTDILADHFSDVAYTCNRVWEAWQVGTMTEDDFTPAEQSEEFMQSLVDDLEVLFNYVIGEDEKPTKYGEYLDEAGNVIHHDPVRAARHNEVMAGQRERLAEILDREVN